MLVGVGLALILAGGVCVVLLRRRHPSLAERVFAVLVAGGGVPRRCPPLRP